MKEEGEENSSSILNPLQIPKLLYKILDHLPVSSVKRAREVSSLWRVEGGKVLLLKTYLDVQSWTKIHDEIKFQEDVQLLSNFLTSTGQKKNVRLKVYASFPITDLVQEIPQLPQRVSTLEYCSWIEESEEIAHILNLFPQLDILKTSSLNLSPSQKWLKSAESESEVQEKINTFLTRLNSLKEIHLNFDLNKHWLGNFSLISSSKNVGVELGLDLENVTSIRFHCRSETDLETFLNSPGTKKWPIKKLRFWFSTEIDPKVTQKLFHQISSTLEHLHVHGFFRIKSGSVPVPVPIPAPVPDPVLGSEIWFLPSDLIQLKTLKIAGKSDDFIEKTLEVALGFKKLKRLQVDKIPVGFYERVSSLESCESLEEVEIGMGDGACFPLSSLVNYSGGFWPNLKSLKIRVFLPESNAVGNLPFSQWSELDRLELKFQFQFKSQGKEEYEKNLKTCHNLILNQTDEKMLKNLTNLKYLQLNLCRPPPEKEGFLSDDLITKCFCEMKQLQSLHLVNFEFSEAVLEDLKTSFGPHVNIQVDEEEEEVLLYGL